MKKFLVLIFCILCITGCGSNEVDEKKTSNERVGYFITIDGNKLMVGDNYDLIKNSLGSNYEYQEVPSCAFEGMDKIYTFNNYEFYNYVEKDIEKIYTITLLNDKVSTNEGIKIGSSVSDVINTYGNDFTDAIGAYTYVKGETLLTFIFDGDKVISIEYKLNLDE